MSNSHETSDTDGWDEGKAGEMLGNDKQNPPPQVPVAIVGMACRLPGHCSTPDDFWDFMMRGGIASNDPPPSRFNLEGHYDASQKACTMKSPGAMFMEHVDPADFDAQFFNINQSDATAMDPQQRQLMEVTYECLENAGIPMESLSGQNVGCFVGASAVDYYDIDLKDVEDRSDSPTIGSSRSILSNRISHFFNIRGPSLSVDTACSSSLTAVNMACLYLNTFQTDGMLVGGVNMYLSPERNQDMGSMRAAASATGKCHVFDQKADGYVAAEAINMIYLKRLGDAVRDGDPVRGVIRGTWANSAGRTAGISLPDAKAQAQVICNAYRNAGIPPEQLVETGYLECHGTGTLAGDPLEVQGIAAVFARTRPVEHPLVIGSVKGNLGHSEAASGLTSVIKATLAVEKGVIPGTATFLSPNPKIDFEGSRVQALHGSRRWPVSTKRRASVNSFGFGGSNAHAIIESPQYLDANAGVTFKASRVSNDNIDFNFFNYQTHKTSKERPKLVVLSANDQEALQASIHGISTHLLHPGVQVSLDDLTFTLSERRSRLHHRAYSVSKNVQLSPASFVTGKLPHHNLRVGFIFTGQGSQWPMMGKGLLGGFVEAREMVDRLDNALRQLPQPPSWSLVTKLAVDCEAESLRNPEISQPIVTALQLAYVAVLSAWGIEPTSVVGHSSGEIAAAFTAGRLTAEQAIVIAYLRGQAAKEVCPTEKLGMLAVGASTAIVEEYLDGGGDHIQFACYNGPQSVTLSGPSSKLNQLMSKLHSGGIFARMLQIDMAYHSSYMKPVGDRYKQLLQLLPEHLAESRVGGGNEPTMFSSTYGWELPCGQMDQDYWVRNLLSPVQFHQAVDAMIQNSAAANFLLEVGPSNTLGVPISQIIQSNVNLIVKPTYNAVSKRATDTLKSLMDVAGKLFLCGGPVNLRAVNNQQGKLPSIVVDLPNYKWNRSHKYWHESLASRDWRFRPFIKHDLLGSKIPNTSWHSPTWKNKLSIDLNPWLADHKLGNRVIFPGTGYICMAMEAMYQTALMTAFERGLVPEEHIFRLRNVFFRKALVLDDPCSRPLIMLALKPPLSSSPAWFEFRISAERSGTWSEHATGFIRIDKQKCPVMEPCNETFTNSIGPRQWYRTLRKYGFNFGPSFQKLVLLESGAEHGKSRAHVSLVPPNSAWKQSNYQLHPACMDGCFQSVTATWDSVSVDIDSVIPLKIDSLVIPFRKNQPHEAISISGATYTGVGRPELLKNQAFACDVFDGKNGHAIFQLKGLRYAVFESNKHDSPLHVPCQTWWDADISLLKEADLQKLLSQAMGDDGDAVMPVARRLMNLVSHQNPRLTVMELCVDSKDTSSLWLGCPSSMATPGHSYSHYTLALRDIEGMEKAQVEHGAPPRTDLVVYDTSEHQHVFDLCFDLIIVKIAPGSIKDTTSVLRLCKSSLSELGKILIIGEIPEETSWESINAQLGFRTLYDCGGIRFCCGAASQEGFLSTKDIIVVSFTGKNHSEIHDALGYTGSKIIATDTMEDVEPKSKVLVVDELWSPVAAVFNDTQWTLLKLLIARECDVLWVTAGAQKCVTSPNTALTHGLFRTLRNETPYLNLFTLDVESACGLATSKAIQACLNLLNSPGGQNFKDSEFVERKGLIYIPRIFPEATTLSTNRVTNNTLSPWGIETQSFNASPATLQLRSEQLGSLDSLRYGEKHASPPDLPPSWVEIEIMASGVNFKDVASILGLVPENEHLLGGEGSGTITRIGSSVTSFHIGQRVAFLRRGAFANRIQLSQKVVHAIPDSMTFEVAATIPCVFATSIYAFCRLARLKRGDSVLIHSATGGVGLSAIELCMYFGVEIYATVGTNEKRNFLVTTYGISEDRIFSSRNATFATHILQQTQGRGVDYILNSLVGDLLDESWRIIAPGGMMIEIGKKDILDGNQLSMEPFGRNASFRAFDLSHESMSDDTLQSLLSEAFELLSRGAVRPVKLMQVYSFSQIPDALRAMRSGKHIGKLVISRTNAPNLHVGVRPSPPDVKVGQDACYILVGSLKGLQSTIAMYLARKGAKNITVLSRGAANLDDKTRRVIARLRGLGCEAKLVTCDVRCIASVREAIQSCILPVKGIVQGAMVLRDRPLNSMTLEDYHEALQCKFQGTWNLHDVTLEQDLRLDFFTLLSSISGVCGSKGQANYAAANAFLDAFATYRQSLGLPACSVDLGPVANVGYLSERDELMDRFDPAVWQEIDDRLLCDIFQSTIERQARTTSFLDVPSMITGLRIPQPEQSPVSRDARFSGLFSGHNKMTDSKDHSMSGGQNKLQKVRKLIQGKAGAAAVLESITSSLDTSLMRILRVSSPLDFARSLSEYGADSLAAVEVRNLVKLEFGVDLTTLDIINAPSLIAINEKIMDEVSKLV